MSFCPQISEILIPSNNLKVLLTCWQAYWVSYVFLSTSCSYEKISKTWRSKITSKTLICLQYSLVMLMSSEPSSCFACELPISVKNAGQATSSSISWNWSFLIWTWWSRFLVCMVYCLANKICLLNRAYFFCFRN